MNTIFIDLTGHDPTRQSFSITVERVMTNLASITMSANIAAWTVTSVQREILEAALSKAGRDGSRIETANSPADVLEVLQVVLEKHKVSAGGPNPVVFYTFNGQLQSQVRGWKLSRGLPIEPRFAIDLVSFTRPPSTRAPNPATPSGKNVDPRLVVLRDRAKRHDVYAELRVREAVYEAARTVIKDTPSVALVSFQDSVFELAEEGAVKKGLSSLTSGSLHIGIKTTLRAMLKAGVVLSHGEPIPHNANEFSTPVHSLEDNAAQKTDQFFVATLFNAMGDIQTEDFVTLAHFYFGVGKAEADGGPKIRAILAQFHELLLSFGERLEKDANGTFRVRQDANSKVQSIAAAG